MWTGTSIKIVGPDGNLHDSNFTQAFKELMGEHSRQYMWYQIKRLNTMYLFYPTQGTCKYVDSLAI